MRTIGGRKQNVFLNSTCICVWIVSEYKDIQGLCQAQVQVVDVVIVIVMFVVHLAILKVRGMISQVIKLKPSCVFRWRFKKGKMQMKQEQGQKYFFEVSRIINEIKILTGYSFQYTLMKFCVLSVPRLIT